MKRRTTVLGIACLIALPLVAFITIMVGTSIFFWDDDVTYILLYIDITVAVVALLLYSLCSLFIDMEERKVEEEKKKIKAIVSELESDEKFLKEKWEESGSRLLCGQWHAYGTIVARLKEEFMDELE